MSDRLSGATLVALAVVLLGVNVRIKPGLDPSDVQTAAALFGEANTWRDRIAPDFHVPLEDGTGDDVYLQLLQTHLTDIVTTLQPDFAFFLAGTDILATDKFGKLNVTLQGCKQRDEMVFCGADVLGTFCRIFLVLTYLRILLIRIRAVLNVLIARPAAIPKGQCNLACGTVAGCFHLTIRFLNFGFVVSYLSLRISMPKGLSLTR